MNGILNILKPPHMTSHDVVYFVKKKLKLNKVGHTGTLDPMAAGVLPICIGKATRISQYLLEDIKRYRCEMTLGYTTDTQDKWGQIIEHKNVEVTNNEIKNAFNDFIGEIYQTPPMYSALKHQGKKLYELAREGKTIEREARKVTIYELKILKVNQPTILFDVLCSKGTYIRTLCEDIGHKLGCGAHMSFLIRTASGKFSIEDTVTLETLQNENSGEIESKYLYNIDYPLMNLSRVNIKKSSERFLLNGNNLFSKNLEDHDRLAENTMVRLYIDNHFAALGKVKCDNELYIDVDRVFY